MAHPFSRPPITYHASWVGCLEGPITVPAAAKNPPHVLVCLNCHALACLYMSQPSLVVLPSTKPSTGSNDTTAERRGGGVAAQHQCLGRAQDRWWRVARSLVIWQHARRCLDGLRASKVLPAGLGWLQRPLLMDVCGETRCRPAPGLTPISTRPPSRLSATVVLL